MDGRTVIERLAARPGGRELLDVAAGREDLALIGGAVRDLMLGREPRELDVVVDRDAARLAEELAARVPGAQTTVHERFGTAAVVSPGARIDIAERRAESYAAPGALPDVRAGSVSDDLERRDFTVNAIAVPLGGPRLGEIDAAEHALGDLAARQLRVLHEGSFIDDPTRLLRLCRYRARLRFEVETDTQRLAREALASGALETVSGVRIAAELWLAAQEGTLASLGELGVLTALGLPASFDEILMEQAAALLPPDGDRVVLAMGILFHPSQPSQAEDRARAARAMDDFEFHAEVRERVLAAAFDAPALARAIEQAERPSQLRAALAGRHVEAVALAGALAARRSPQAALAAERWLGELRNVALEIGGDDVIAAGIPEGPEIGRRLQLALDRKLDGELGAGREAELAAALEADA
jgi:tRNA nucleotidyltransferase (CCA-adding enzyme)